MKKIKYKVNSIIISDIYVDILYSLGDLYSNV